MMNATILGIIKHEMFDKTVEVINYNDADGVLLENKQFYYKEGLLITLFIVRLPIAFCVGLLKAITVLAVNAIIKGYVSPLYYNSYFRHELEGHAVVFYDVFRDERQKIQKRMETFRKRHFEGELESNSTSGFLYEEVEVL